MKSQTLLYSFLLLFLIPNLISTKPSIEIRFNKKQPVHNPDLCQNRPYVYSPEPLYFIPVQRAKLFDVGEQYSFESRCFSNNIVTLSEISINTITLKLENYNKTETFCSELFIFHTSNKNFLQFVAFAGEHEIVLKRVTQDDKDEIKLNGIKLYSFCNGFFTTLKSLYNSLKLFYGGLGLDANAKNPRFKPTILKDQEKANLRFLELYSHYTPERRNNTVVYFDKSYVHSGDLILIARLDGLDPLIMAGAGGHFGHCCVASWIDGELYVLESQSAWYWPVENIQKTKWETWLEWAHNADYNAVLLPLREEYRQKIDVDKANKWFKETVEGLPYGYHNFVFSFIDTKDRNFPWVTTNDFAELFFSIISKVYTPFTDLIITEALNLRLGTEGLTFQQAVAEFARRGKAFEEVMAEPEIDGLEYHDGLSYVCSAFVAAYWKNAGLFGDMIINPSEFGPKDLYQMDIFDKNTQRPQECIDDNPDLPYCQLMGKFRVTLDNYCTITPYSNMNERCSSLAPDFIREEGC